jgi:hypothetical protein
VIDASAMARTLLPVEILSDAIAGAGGVRARHNYQRGDQEQAQQSPRRAENSAKELGARFNRAPGRTSSLFRK